MLDSDHNVSLINDYTFFAAFEESIFLHEFEGVENAISFKSH